MENKESSFKNDKKKFTSDSVMFFDDTQLKLQQSVWGQQRPGKNDSAR